MIRTLITMVFLALLSTVVLASQKNLTEPSNTRQIENLKSYGSTVKLSIKKIEDRGDKKLVYIKLKRTQDNRPMTLDKLKEVHTQKIHILILDEGLQDYAHIHPLETTDPGVYKFEWTPKARGHYRVWAELVPLNTNTTEYAVTDLMFMKNNKSNKPDSSHTVSMENTVEGLTFKLSFDSKDLRAGKAYMGRIDVSDAQGMPIEDLEPIMGSFAHIVGFSDGLTNVVHIHPMGKEPTSETDRSGPEFEFHIEPKNSGFIKIFVQVRFKGKEIIVPFGIEIQKAR